MKLYITILTILLILSIYPAQADVNIISPTGGTYDSEVVNIKAMLTGDGNFTTPLQIKISNDPFISSDMAPFSSYFIYPIDFSQFENGPYEIAVETYNSDTAKIESATVSVIVQHTSNITPPSDSLKTMRTIGISNTQKITDNETRMIYVKVNNTDQPVEGATIYILKDASTISNTFSTSTSGRAKIEWVDTDGKPLPNDIYFFKIEKSGYHTIEYDIEIDYSIQEEEKPELSIWGLDRKYNTDSIAPDIVRVKGSDTDKYLSDVVIKIITGSGVPVTDNMITNEYGTIDFKTSGITPGSYSVVFEHPDYETKLQDITISYVPTPTPTPTPPPTEFIWNGITFPIPHTVTLRDGSLKSYSTSTGFDADFTKDNNGATVERVRTPTPTPTPTVQANSTGGIPTDTPSIKAGWLLLAILVIGVVVRTVYKNHSQINPGSGGLSGLISNLKNRDTQPDNFIPEQVNEADFDISGSILQNEEPDPISELEEVTPLGHTQDPDEPEKQEPGHDEIKQSQSLDDTEINLKGDIP